MAGQIVKRGAATWLVRVPRGRGPDGTRLYHNRTVHGSKRDAERYRTQVLRELHLGIFVQAGKQTVSELLNEWLLVAVAPRVRRRTAEDYARIARTEFIPSLGHRRVADLAPSDIQAVYAAMSRRGLAPRTIRYAHSVLNNALNQSVRWGRLARNPAALVDLPRKIRREMRPLNNAEARSFISAAGNDEFAALWLLLLSAGIRPSEALGLRWSDMEAGRIHIQRALTRYSDGTVEFNAPKTSRGRRVVTLPESMTGVLREHRHRQLADRLRAGPAWDDKNLIFATNDGRPLDFRVLVRRHFNKILRAAGVPTIRPYDLRHTCATLLLQAGQNPRIVSERLGHESVALTLDTYSHVLPSMQEESAVHLERLLFLHEAGA